MTINRSCRRGVGSTKSSDECQSRLPLKSFAKLAPLRISQAETSTIIVCCLSHWLSRLIQRGDVSLRLRVCHSNYWGLRSNRGLSRFGRNGRHDWWSDGKLVNRCDGCHV